MPSPDPAPPPHTLIRARGELLALGERLRGASELCVDTEFHSEDSYFPELMLIQLATETELVVIDPLAEELRSLIVPFFSVLARQGKRFVGHALKGDLANLLRGAQVAPTRVFDTQIAAAFLGHGDQIGLAPLLEARLGVKLDKLYSRADWSRRPLPPGQLAYALDDVRHLPALAASMRAELERRGRLAWVEAEHSALRDAASFEAPRPEDAWRRVARRPQEARALLAVMTLAAARERIAQRQDVPVGRVLKDELLVDLARRAPSDAASLAGETHRRGTNAYRAHEGAWLAALREAAARPEGIAPERAPSSPHADAVAALGRLLVGLRLREIDLAPGLAPQELEGALRALALGPPLDRAATEARLGLEGWRRDLLLEPLLALLDGRARLSVGRDDAGAARVVLA